MLSLLHQATSHPAMLGRITSHGSNTQTGLEKGETRDKKTNQEAIEITQLGGLELGC